MDSLNTIPKNKPTPKQTIMKVGLVVISIAVLIFGIFMLVQVLLKNSSTYKMAIEELTNNPIANELVGDSIRQKGFVFGSTKTSGASGEAELRFNILSSNGKFTIFATGVSEFGEWRLTGLYTLNEEQELNSIIPGQDPFEGSWHGVDNDDDYVMLVFSDSNWEISWPGTAYPSRSGTYIWRGNTVNLMGSFTGQAVISEDSLTGNMAEVTFTLTRR